jgi:hypothetical protein
MGELCEHTVRALARVSALGDAEEAQSSTSGLLRRCMGAMTRSDKGNGHCVLRR